MAADHSVHLGQLRFVMAGAGTSAHDCMACCSRRCNPCILLIVGKAAPAPKDTGCTWQMNWAREAGDCWMRGSVFCCMSFAVMAHRSHIVHQSTSGIEIHQAVVTYLRASTWGVGSGLYCMGIGIGPCVWGEGGGWGGGCPPWDNGLLACNLMQQCAMTRTAIWTTHDLRHIPFPWRL